MATRSPADVQHALRIRPADASISDMQYLLCEHVHLCSTVDGAVFLDLKNDRYCAIGRAEALALKGIVRGWPDCETLGVSGATGETASDVAGIVRELCDSGLLTTDDKAGRAATPPSVRTLSSLMYEADHLQQPRIRVKHVFQFMVTCIVTALQLKLCSLNWIVQRSRQQKDARDKMNGPVEPDQVLPYLAIFRRLRPFFYSGKNHCLYDSLAMKEFLAKNGLSVTWLIGVKTGPFGAHSWVQAGDRALNATLEQTREFTPIIMI